MQSIHRDVVVIGAGATGLTVATELEERGLSVAVLEARDRVGGRLLTTTRDGQFFELGGQWFSPDQDALQETLERLGLESFERHRDGENIYIGPDREPKRYLGDVFPTSSATESEIDKLTELVESLVSEIDPAEPWSHPRAAELDAISFGAWLGQHSTDEEAVRNVTLFIASAMLTKPGHSFSVLQALQMAASAGSFANLIDPDWVLDRRVVGGFHKIPERLAAELSPEDLFLSSPVHSIEWSNDSVTARSKDHRVQARWAVIAVPPNVQGKISFQPALPASRLQSLQHQSMGQVIKVQARYSEPFWRPEGLSGTAFSPYETVHEAYDNTAVDEHGGTLVGFVSDVVADALLASNAAERRRAILQSFAAYFGPKALQPIAYCESDWADEEWTAGAYGTSFDIGGLTRYGADQTKPIGPLRFGSSDIAGEGYMHVDGAIRVGRKLAAEIATEVDSLSV